MGREAKIPNITDFDAGNLALRPSETGVEAFAAAGRRIGAFYNQEGHAIAEAGARIGRGIQQAGDAAVAYADHQQINAGADHGATLFATLTDSWNKTSANADVHDPTVAQKWREEQLEPALQQFTQGFTTEKSQEWANRFVNTMRQHYFTKTEADMSSMASVAAHESVTNAVTKYSNTAVTDPSSVDTSIALFKQNLDDVIAANPNIKGPDAARVRLEVAEKGVRQIVQAGAMGAILNARDPEAAAAAWSKKYPGYVNGAEELQLAKAAKIQAKQNTLLNKQIQTENIRQAEFKMNSTINEASDKYVKINPDGTSTISPEFVKTVNDLPKTGAPNAWKMKEELGNWIEKQQKDPTGGSTDPAVRDDFNNRLSTLTTRELRLAQIPDAQHPNGRLSNKDFAAYEGFIKDRDTDPLANDPTFRYATEYAKEIFASRLGATKFQEGQFPAFMQKFMAAYKMASEGDKANALNINDPKSLFSTMLSAATSANLPDSIRDNGGVPSVPAYTPPSTPATKETVIGSKAEYDALAPGASFTYHGKKFTKPTAKDTATLAPGEM